MSNLGTAKRESNFSNLRRLGALCGVAILLYTPFHWPLPKIDFRLILLTIITIVISSRFAVKIPRVNTNVTISDTFVFLALLIYGPLAALWLATAEGFSSGIRISKRPLTIAFNCGMMICSTFGTILIIQATFGKVSGLRNLPWQPFIAATAIMALAQYAINTGLSCLALIVNNGGPFFRTWYKHYLWTSISFIASATIAAWTSTSFEQAGVPVLIITAPVIALIYFTYHKYLNEVKEAAEQAERAERLRADEAEQHVQELKKSDAQHRQLFESNPQPIYVVDDATYRILATNPAANIHYDYSTCEFKTLKLRDLWPAFSPDLYQELTEENDNKTVFQHLTRLGETVDVEIVSRPIEFEDRQARLLLLKDVTAHRRAVAERTAREAADESARIKSEFLANMSHEIRTPMNGILGMTELALQTPLTDQQRSYLEIVQSSSLNLLTIINDILDFSKIEAGKLNLEEIPFNLSQLVGELTRALALPAHEKRLELAWQTSAGIPPELIGDPIRLRQILTNLVSNAIKFTHHGEVIVRVKQVASRNNHVSLKFAISDTGIGIPSDKQALVFQSFAQADGSTTRKYGGTGLGLAISAKLVQLMGGNLTVESKETEGSTFQFTIDLACHQTTTSTQQTSPKFENLNVLVVDDNSTNRTILEETLTHWHMHPKAVTCGRDAITSIKTASEEGHPFSLILLDACMPEMDGFEVARQLKSLPETASATIMMLTSIDHLLNINRLKELGIVQSLVKPVSQTDLYTAIQKLIDPSAAPTTPITPTVSNEKLSPRNLLLVEDNLTNQKLAVWTLEKEGHMITVVGNGLEAIEALKEGSFDAILMDVQMPVMNGLDATRQIRKEEKSTGRHIPIIAMTALAMKGDKQRCLDAGMDHYISKPIRSAELFNALNRIFEQSPQKESAASLPTQPANIQPQPNGHKTFDRTVFLERISNDNDLAVKLVNTFLNETPTITSEIERALREQNNDLLYRSAHSLKSSAAIFGAEQTVTLALQLESMGRSKTTADAPQTFRDLQKEIDFLYQDLKKTFIPSG